MRRAHAIYCGCLLFFLLGCNNRDWGTAAGTAFLDGQPMQKGTITFEPVDGGATAYAVITPGGTFRVMTGNREGLKPGDYQVTVVDQTIPEHDATPTVTLLTPARYASIATSDLTAIINPGANALEFHLKK